jgi:hypothetical protein
MANGKGVKFYLGIFIIVIAVIELVKLSILSRYAGQLTQIFALLSEYICQGPPAGRSRASHLIPESG